GAPTDDALAAMAARVRGHSVDTIVAAVQVQRGAGGDLAGLLRRAARGFEDEARLRGEVKAATAQARFTGLVVALLPFGGAVLAELASPGFVAGLLGSFLSAWLVGMAVAMQAGAAWAIHRLGKVKG
ncbi:MAG: type II secretion system F family protein, partial [Thermoleophilaceae bacterium]|nr:type II secretion system F family protein [Thermoleophilaceae bacterium]